MIELVLATSDATALESKLLGQEDERCAILFVNEVKTNGNLRLLVRDVQVPEPSDYTSSGPLEAELNPDIVARATKHARREAMGLIFVHSHPGNEPPVFSDIDGWGERRLAEFLAHRHPDVTHAALVISTGGVRARRL